MSGVISAMSDVLKIVKGRPEGHAIRSCFIGMRILQELRLTPALRTIISQSQFKTYSVAA